ncbi:MAG: ribonuclease P protein subunit [Candidatus Lokiarchaeota archaeon]|nr:ribonuclease P protein subunit [Candidatus Lokiarchaeota archaeon]
MNTNPKYLIYHDLIGFYIYAKIKSKPKKYIEFDDIGLIINDTKNMLTTKKDNVVKKYIKKDYIFKIKLPKTKEDEQYFLEVDGKKIVGRPEKRLRSLKKKKRFIK